MIARLWHGITPKEKTEAYLQLLNRTGVPDLRATPGNRGVYVMHHIEGELTHFILISLWDSEEAIRRFAGEDVTRARYYPEDHDFLLELEPIVTHYQVDVAG